MKKIVFAALALSALAVAPRAFGNNHVVFTAVADEDKSCEDNKEEGENEEKSSEEGAISSSSFNSNKYPWLKGFENWKPVEKNG
ncbi:hypothetical protein [Chlamydiifrater phoenicopteri]|uniref:hypothetical protein n=1 Tax=Chlamydiifrater phoenicopteri TaxID=2681469 RepID=UPI001BCF71D0|nr:hypothetical protein [Chlamydiifrater phoenicopteri]